MNEAEIIAVNPGSTSTKIGIFRDGEPMLTETFRHDAAFLKKHRTIWGQFEFRMEAVDRWIQSNAGKPAAVVGIGGLLRPVSGGTYGVNNKMLADARANIQGEHASNLGCAMATHLAKKFGCRAFVVDPVSVDEFNPLARYSGHPLIKRRSLSHALNIHAVARRAAGELGRSVERTIMVVAHLGGGISVAAVQHGRIVDVNDAASGGPFSPERTGSLPLQPFIDLCFSGDEDEASMRKLVMGKGGLVAYLGTNSAVQVEQRIASGDEQAREVYEAMAYQIGKEIGAMAAVNKGKTDAIVLTGGLATSEILTGWIKSYIKSIARVFVYPGENELEALALGALRVLRGEERALEY